MSTVLTDLPTGHTFDPVSFTIDAERVRAYTGATGDSLAVYEERSAAPPLAVAAFALGALLKIVSLPDGTLHGSESFQVHAEVPIGATVQCEARVAQKSARGGLVICVLESDVKLEGRNLLTTRAMVICPGETQ